MVSGVVLVLSEGIRLLVVGARPVGEGEIEPTQEQGPLGQWAIESSG